MMWYITGRWRRSPVPRMSPAHTPQTITTGPALSLLHVTPVTTPRRALSARATPDTRPPRTGPTAPLPAPRPGARSPGQETREQGHVFLRTGAVQHFATSGTDPPDGDTYISSSFHPLSGTRREQIKLT